MSNTRLEEYRELLGKLSADVRESITEVSEEVQRPTGGQADGGLSNVPMHLGDLGTDTYMQELSSVFLETEQDLSTEIDAALRRVDDGSFGNCEACGQSIPEDRLQVLPYTRYCVHCSETAVSQPSANLNRGRPHGPQDILANNAGTGRR